MYRVKSESNKRLIVRVKVNDKDAYMLLDTGASVGFFDINQKKKFGLIEGKPYNGTLVGAGGEVQKVKYCNTMANIQGRTIPQFLLADISSVIKSVESETGIKILGIISLPQMKIAHIGIDCDDMDIIIE